MAVYSITTDGGKHRDLQVTMRFKVFDMVTITLRNEKIINGEIIFIGEKEIHVTGPYLPIETIKMTEIANVSLWNPPEDWK